MTTPTVEPFNIAFLPSPRATPVPLRWPQTRATNGVPLATPTPPFAPTLAAAQWLECNPESAVPYHGRYERVAPRCAPPGSGCPCACPLRFGPFPPVLPPSMA